MNFLLSLNKKIFLIFSFAFIIFILFVFLLNFTDSTDNSQNKITLDEQTSDISEPKFSINSKKQKISVTANEGNFLTEDEIILEKNVIFKSNKFKIYTDNVVFNKKTLVASIQNNSKFISEFRDYYITTESYDKYYTMWYKSLIEYPQIKTFILDFSKSSPPLYYHNSYTVWEMLEKKFGNTNAFNVVFHELLL